MKKEGYDFIDYKEDTHWWFLTRKEIFFNLIKQYNDNINDFLDIGCGTGSFLKEIKQISKNTYGIDPHEYNKTKHKNILKGTAEDIPFKDNFFDFISCFDVLEHLEDPKLAINEIYRVLKPNGYAIISVPSCQLLFGPHDKENEHKKRFSKKDLENLIGNEFEIIKSSYFNTLLFPAEAPIRFTEKIINKKITKNDAPKEFLNNLLYKIFSLEKQYLLKHNYHFGMSNLIIIRKK